MPEETISPVSVPSPVTKNSKISPKNILIGLAVGILLMILGFGGFYLYLNQNTSSGSLVSNNSATSSAKPAKTASKNTIVWIQKSDVWVKETGKDAKKVYTEPKKILDWDVLADGKIVYITTTEKSKDEIYGTAIVSLNLKTLNKETLYEKSIDQIIAEKPKVTVCNFDDTDISALAVSKDGKNIAYAASGIYLLNISTKKSELVVKTAGPNGFIKDNSDTNNVSNCITYTKTSWVNNTLLDVSVQGWEGGGTYLVDTVKQSVVSSLSTGWYSTVLQIGYPPSDLVLITGIPPAYTANGSTIYKSISSTNTVKYYSSKDYINERVIDGDKVYFVEEDETESQDQPFTFRIKSFSLSSQTVEPVLDSTTALIDSYYNKCLLINQSSLYFQITETKGTLDIYKFDIKTKEKVLIVAVPYDVKAGLYTNACFKLTTL